MRWYEMRNPTLGSAITICLALALHAQTPRVAGGFSTDWEHLTIETRQLAANVYLLHGSGGNTLALIGPDGKLLVDTEFAQAAPRLKEALDKLDAGKVRYERCGPEMRARRRCGPEMRAGDAGQEMRAGDAGQTK